MEMNKELLEKAKLAKNPEELMLLAKENCIEFSQDEACTYFAKLNPKGGVLADDELDDVSGGEKCQDVDGCLYYKKRDNNVENDSGKCGDCFYYIDNKCKWAIERLKEIFSES